MKLLPPRLDKDTREWVVYLYGIPYAFTDEVYANEFWNLQAVNIDPIRENGYKDEEWNT